MNSSPPSDMSDPSSTSHQDDGYQKTAECLRKLQQDITIFSDPKVRSHLHTIPLMQNVSSPSTSSSQSQDPAELQASIITLRTTIQQLGNNLDKMKQNDLHNRKRAARAEAELSELKSQQSVTQNTYQSTIHQATERYLSLEKDTREKEGNNANENRKLQKQYDDLKVKFEHAEKQVAFEKQQHEQSQGYIKQFEKEMALEKASLQSEKDSLDQLKKNIENREEEIRTLFENQSNGSHNQQHSNASLPLSRIENENKQLKHELEWISLKLSKSEKQLTQIEQQKTDITKQMKDLILENSKVKQLQNQVVQLEHSERNVAQLNERVQALQKEKEAMTDLIAALSGDRKNVQEGLATLSALADRQNDKGQALTIFKNWFPNHSILASSNTTSSDSDVNMTDKPSQMDENVVDNVENEYVKIEGEQRQKHISAEQQRDSELEDGKKKSDNVEKTAVRSSEQQLGDPDDQEVPEGEADYDSKVCKVVHFVENPLRKAQQMYKEANNQSDLKSVLGSIISDDENHQSNNDSLRGKKRIRGGSAAGSGDEIGDSKDKENENQMSEWVKWKEEMEKKLAEMKQKAVVGDRTKVVALKRIDEVRSAVYNLFGWQMKIRGAVYELSSIYAESQMEALHFCVNEDGGMSLMDCDYAQRLSNELEQYVERMNSFPSLLAHITMTNFEKSTAFQT